MGTPAYPTITGNDTEGYIAAVYRTDSEVSIGNARSQLYTERGLKTRQDAVDTLVGVARSCEPKEGLQEEPIPDTLNAGDGEEDKYAYYTSSQKEYVDKLSQWDGAGHSGYFRLGDTPQVHTTVGIPIL